MTPPSISTSSRRRLTPLALALVLGCTLLAACGTPFGPRDTDKPSEATAVKSAGDSLDKPPAAPVRALGANLTVGNEQAGNPVELGRDQRLTVRLRFAGATTSDWTLVALEPGVLREIGSTHYEHDLTAAVYGEVAGTQVWRFEPVQPGQVTLHFELRVPRSRAPASETASFAVTVR